MTDSEFKRILSNPDKLSGPYLFFGEEELIKSRYAEMLAAAVCGEDTFSRTVLDGDSTSPGELEAAVAAFPMMSERNFVHLRAAPVSSWKDAQLSEYIAVFGRAKDYPQTVLLVTADASADFGNVARNKPNTLYKKLSAVLETVQFDRKGGAQLRRWVERHFTAAGVPFGYNTADALISRSGSDMFVLSGECEKLIAYSKSHGECEITPETVDFVACPDLSEEAFALSNAILSGDRAAALDALSKAKNRREEPIALLYSVSKVMSDMLSVATYASAGMTRQEISKKLKMHEYKTGLYMRAAGNDTAKLERSINRCLEADLAMKSSTLGYIALERLICG